MHLKKHPSRAVRHDRTTLMLLLLLQPRTAAAQPRRLACLVTKCRRRFRELDTSRHLLNTNNHQYIHSFIHSFVYLFSKQHVLHLVKI